MIGHWTNKADSTQTQLIDDIEDKNGGNGLGYGCFTNYDKANAGDSVMSPAPCKLTSSQGEDNGSKRAAKMIGKVTKTFPYPNITKGTNLGENPIDIGKYKDIEFWAKGDGKEFQSQLHIPLIKDFNKLYRLNLPLLQRGN
jgi:hypothetical protein